MADPAAFDRPELAPLWAELRRRFEAGGPVRTVRLAGLQLEQRAALADLLGLARLPPERLTIPVSRLDEALCRVLGHGARDLVEALSGRCATARASGRPRPSGASRCGWSSPLIRWCAPNPRCGAGWPGCAGPA